MDKNGKIILYVVKPGDSIESIALKFNTTKENILRLNNGIKYHNIYPGIPLNIESYLEENNITNQRHELQENNWLLLLYKKIIYIRSSILFSLFIPSLKNEMNKKVKDIISEFYNQKKEKDSESLQIEQFEHYLIGANEEIASALANNDVNKAKNLISNKKRKKKEYLEYLESLNNSSIWKNEIQLMKDIDELWLVFILKYSSKQIEEAENAFDKILKISEKKW